MGRAEGGRDDGEEEEEEEGRGYGWGERGIHRQNEWGETEIVEDFDDADSRTMFIHEEGKREKWSNYSSFMSARE